MSPCHDAVCVRLRQFTLLAVTALFPVLAFAADDLEWAYPLPKVEHDPPDNRVLLKMPESTRSYTQAQIDDLFAAPDWFPDEHPLMPKVVAQGVKPAGIACARCHFPSGDGHPEAPMLGGQSVSYLQRQIVEFKNGGRKGDVHADTMANVAKGISDEDALAASQYFAALKPRNWDQTVETDMVPVTYFGHGAIRFAKPGGEKEPLGNRIIVVAQDDARAKSRDPHSGFINYVPMGSLKKGEALVATGAEGKSIPCAVCHGIDLRGQGEIPAIAGRQPLYMFRQLNGMKTGTRSGNAMEQMKVVVEKLSTDDFVAIAAYLATLPP
jgi:cytochrome c553